MRKILFVFIFLTMAYAGTIGCQQLQNNQSKPHYKGILKLKKDAGFNSNPKIIRYSRHARCRMECRHITENEIGEIIHNGKIDYRKSQLQADNCQKRYALEGNTNENQYLRVIVAECGDVLTVITCIDLKEDWPCSCH
ncbi:DUF4258 domain-containing protein [Hydrotalea sp.]|uniref:DUF4258 domain-containing protein n=1 Tax=Hydrotalea sp. TaxID=2881279 RepID=UPI00258F8384|nr:DUF4258 domain-containing protein [Hydrotalea sp.]